MRHTQTRTRNIALVLTALLALPALTAQAAKLYKWVDENGQVRYGDSIPPQYARKSNETLNGQGIVVDRKAAAKTPEQIAKEERSKAARLEQEKIRRAKLRQDRILLDTFSNEDEMVMTRDGKIEAIEAVIRVTRGRSENIRQRLAKFKQQAANLERAGKPVPDTLKAEIRESHQQMAHNERYIKSRRKQQQQIREQFAHDIERFRKLKTAEASIDAE
ncbi:MAG: DUF4124 domain-containing protein [Thiogranum sp.]